VPLRGIGTGRVRRGLNAEVNIINLVDVVLVLLLIFMLTAPMLQGGVEVSLPRVASRPLEAREGLNIAVTRDGRVAVKDVTMSFEEFAATIQSVVALEQPEGIYIRSDRRATAGDLTRVLAVLQRVGIENVGLVTEQEENR
jgi:biopolymer transport protein ExbD/biopolymer transport protein TolR